MPIVTDEKMRELLEGELISAITADTNIFDEKRLQLNSATLRALASLKDRPIDFLLSGTVFREVLAHMTAAASAALRSSRKEIGKALFAFDTDAPTRDELIAQITGGKTAEEAAKRRLIDYVDHSGCEILNDASLVDVVTLFEGYFSRTPPFGVGKKKAEFPDALALNALERTAANRGSGIIVVSKDNDWRSFCEKSARLYLVPEIEKALDFVNNAPLGVRTAIASWTGPEGDGRHEMIAHLRSLVEQIDFSASGHATSSDLEAVAWGGTLRKVEWEDYGVIDVIEIQQLRGSNGFRAVVSIPLLLAIRVPIELSFSVWDNVDKESVSIAGRAIDYDAELEVRATFTLDVYSAGTVDEDLQYVDGELDMNFHEIDLGEVDVFEDDDFDYPDEDGDA